MKGRERGYQVRKAHGYRRPTPDRHTKIAANRTPMPETEDRATVARVKVPPGFRPRLHQLERCYAFGEAVARIVTGLGLRTVALEHCV